MPTFPNFPSSVRVPLTYVDVDMSLAASGNVASLRTLIVGQRLSTGEVAAGVPTRIRNASEADAAFGQGSLIARALRAYSLNDAFGELWGLALADDGAAVAAQGRITVTGPASADGVIPLYIASQRLRVSVADGDTATDMGDAIVAAVTATPQLPVTAANVAGVVTFTARNKGTLGNFIDLRWCLLGAAGGETLPAGVGLALTAKMGVTTAGATDPSVATAIAAMADSPYEFVVQPYQDADNLALWATEFDQNTGRWSWQRLLYGGYFSATVGTVGQREAFGEAENDPHHYVFGYPGNTLSGGVAVGSPTPPWEWAAAHVGAIAGSLRDDPSLPLHTLEVRGVTAPEEAYQDTLTDRNTLLFDGISTSYVDASGTVRVEKVISTYQVDALGAEDDSWLDIQTAYTLAAILRDLRGGLNTSFARFKVVNDGTPIADGARMISPRGMRAYCVGRYLEYQRRGWVENIDAFIEHLDVVRNEDNPRRLDIVFPPDMANPLDQIAVLAQPRLQYPA